MKGKRKRVRTPSLEAQIRQSAREIHATGIQEAMKAAAFMVCAKKLDEIKAILTGAGLGAAPARSVLQSVQPDVPAVQHACTYCGAESVYRTRPNRFNRTGTWLCRAHLPLRVQHEQAATTDARVRDASGAVQEGDGAAPPLAPEKKDTGGDVTAADAFAALGVQ